jgi:hypothetical protein
MLNTSYLIRALVAGTTLLQLGAADAEVNYTRSLNTSAGYDQVSTTTPDSHTWNTPAYSISTSGSAVNNGTAEASFSVLSGTFSVTQSVWYIINLTGPANVLVPVHITADGYAQIFGTTLDSASADFEMFSGQQNPLVKVEATAHGPDASTAGSAQATLSFDQIVYVLANTDVYVSLVVGGGSNSGTHPATVTGHAFLDPQFIVDPAYASQYAFVGLPVSAVPEPTIAAMLALGGGLLAFARRRS